MKRSLIAAAALSAVLLAACGNEPSVPVEATVSDTSSVEASDSSEAAASVTAADITSAVTAEIEIPSAVEKNVDNIGAFYDVDTSAVTDMSVLICGSGAYPDELAVFKFTDGEAAKTGAEAVQKRLDDQTELYRDYTPDEVYKLEDAFVIAKDEWVIMSICSDNSRSKEIIEAMLP